MLLLQFLFSQFTRLITYGITYACFLDTLMASSSAIQIQDRFFNILWVLNFKMMQIAFFDDLSVNQQVPAE